MVPYPQNEEHCLAGYYQGLVFIQGQMEKAEKATNGQHGPPAGGARHDKIFEKEECTDTR